MLERGDDVGGTWHYNTYPGCACDVPSHLYSFSFAPNPGWSETYSRQPEIRDYLHRVADEYGVREKVRLNCAVESIEWQDGGWTIATSDGPLRARVVVAGMGPLAEPKIPPIEGIDAFEGETFHSARWNHDYDLRGKRVAAIGTGASAIQFVPEIQKQAAQVHVVQRTAPWVMPHPSRPIRGWEKRLYDRVPALQKLVRGGIYAGRELLVLGFVKNPRLMKVPERIARRHMRSQISDPGAAGEGHARLHDRLQAHPPVQPLVPRALAAQRRAAHRRRREAHPQLGDHRRRRGARGRRDHLRHRLPGHRHAGRPDGARAGRQDARRRLAGQPEGAPRRRDAGLPEPVRPARAEHRPRPLVDGLHDRVAGGLRARRAEVHGRAPRRHRRGERRGDGPLQRRHRRAHAGHGVEHRLRQLVPRRDRAQRDAVAGLDVRLPPPDRAVRPRRLRAEGGGG